MKKIDKMVVNVTKISQKMKSKNLLSIEKYYGMRGKCLIIVIRNYYYLKSNYLARSFDEEYKDVLKL